MGKLVNIFLCVTSVACFLHSGLQQAEASVVEQYVGCFSESNPNRVMTVSTTDKVGYQTVESCIRDCGDLGYTYAGAQYGCSCFCGHAYFNQTSNSCSMPCCGNTSQTCGNAWTSDVYAVCPKGKYQWINSRECGQQCGHCSEKICHINTGACLSGCEPGWTGINCALAGITEFTQLSGCPLQTGFYAFGLHKQNYQDASRLCALHHPGAYLAALRQEGIQNSLYFQIRKAGYIADCEHFIVNGQRENSNCESRFVWKFPNNEDTLPVDGVNWCTDPEEKTLCEPGTLSVNHLYTYPGRGSCFQEYPSTTKACFICEYQPQCVP